MSSSTLSIKQTELAILSQIIDEYKLTKGTNNLGVSTPLFTSDTLTSGESMFITQKLLTIQTTLQSLEEKGLIKIISMFGTLDGIKVSIVDLHSLLERHNHLYESIPATGNLPRIVYSLRKGTGKINGEAFRFNRKSDNYILFRKLIKSPEHRLSRSDAWKAINRRESIADTVAIQDFSRIVSKLRAGLRSMSKDHLKYSKKSLTLFADIFLTD